MHKYIFIFVLLYIISNCSLAIAQKSDTSENNDRFYVQYLDEISSKDAVIKDKSFLQSVAEFFVGKDQERLLKPYSIFAEDTSNIIVLDQDLQTIVKIDLKKPSFDIIEFDSVKAFPSLVAITKLPQNKVAITDSRYNKVFVCDIANNTVRLLNDTLNLDHPTGIAYCELTNQIWVVETGKHRIVVLDNNGQIIRTIGQRGNNPEEFNYPTNIWIDKNGKVYIIDAMNYRVQIFNQDGKFLNTFGEIGDASGFFASLKGIATDSFGHIYIVDAAYHTVQIFNEKGDFLYNFGNQGTSQGKFWLPTGIYIDEDNHIYVTDSFNRRVQIFELKRR
jgi:DNA-binding beta-propeller fold protein YncE